MAPVAVQWIETQGTLDASQSAANVVSGRWIESESARDEAASRVVVSATIGAHIGGTGSKAEPAGTLAQAKW